MGDWDEVRLASMEARLRELERRMKMASDWHDTLNSPPWKRVWFWMQGYKMFSLGTWYTAPWNRAAGDKYNRGF